MSIKTDFNLNLELEEIIKRIEGLNLTVDNLQSRFATIPTLVSNEGDFFLYCTYINIKTQN